ncbi:isocitrate lyase/PEP mutase family protein [Variovorax sp. PBL-E5]|uniref:isocitrate lyase/PEP mutase family protein n=1 Tax=Variovorax sp. PBL-E5 TaxID=434014 RepID=UPI0013182809|nr:isocitrate lyase/PEP mutase family protein [Variovorax sp. PBL-E5]VTU38487.1 2,3-dimethylmalate lyase [Variovorax sp. PBL-E5]
MVVAPGVYDGISARMAERSPFRAMYMSGYMVAASRYGLPDAGIIGMNDMVDALRTIRGCTTKPIICDADTGYGGLVNVQHTVRGYESAGASALHIEDQEMPKKCGHTKGKRVVPVADMVAKVEVAASSRRSEEFLIIARTDSLASEGFERAMARLQAYREAGADIVFMDAPTTVEPMRAVAAAFPRQSMINIVPYRHFMTPEVSVAALANMGFAIAIFPGVMSFPSIGSMERSLAKLANDEPADFISSQISPHEPMGFPQVWADEQRWGSATAAPPPRPFDRRPTAGKGSATAASGPGSIDAFNMRGRIRDRVGIRIRPGQYISLAGVERGDLPQRQSGKPPKTWRHAQECPACPLHQNHPAAASLPGE